MFRVGMYRFWVGKKPPSGKSTGLYYVYNYDTANLIYFNKSLEIAIQVVKEKYDDEWFRKEMLREEDKIEVPVEDTRQRRAEIMTTLESLSLRFKRLREDWVKKRIIELYNELKGL